MNTGERIKNLRIEKGLSQEELGALVGVQKAAINKYETGVVVNLKREMIGKLADALETTPAFLMGWDDPDTKSADDEDLEMLHKTPELRILLSASKKLRKSDIGFLVDMAKRMNEDE